MLLKIKSKDHSPAPAARFLGEDLTQRTQRRKGRRGKNKNEKESFLIFLASYLLFFFVSPLVLIPSLLVYCNYEDYGLFG